MPKRDPVPGVTLPEGRGWVYFAIMAMGAAFFGGIILHYLHKFDPLRTFG